MNQEFPEVVKRFLAEHINSVAQLELLLLLYGTPDRSWDAKDASETLRTTAEMTGHQLEMLRGKGLLEVADGSAYRYAPRSKELADQVELLETTYRERRVAVITEIYSQPTDNVQTFADAFRLRKDNEP